MKNIFKKVWKEACDKMSKSIETIKGAISEVVHDRNTRAVVGMTVLAIGASMLISAYMPLPETV